LPEDPAAVDLATGSWGELIADAIAGRGIVPAYQPIVDLQRGGVAGYEALARFPDGPRVGPDVWFREAARLGHAEDLDAAVVRAVMAQRPTLPPNTFLTVNVEPESLVHGSVGRVLASFAPLDGLVVEVTEHRPLGDADAVAAALDRLRALGALVAVDDAGAGHSGLQQILTLRPQILKLDRELVRDCDTDESRAALIEMLGLFASRIDAWILAEGIETPGEAERCRQLGVPLGQGWHFARPAPPWSTAENSAPSPGDADVAPRRGLRPLLSVAPTVAAADLGGAARRLGDDPGSVSGDEVWVVVDGERPVGALTPDAALGGQLLRPLRANADASATEVARRLAAAAPPIRALPVVVTDDLGRYLGVVTGSRLLGHLADLADECGAGPAGTVEVPDR
jgi:EAL domain-containing protein (putative c-di-GMP-specific phosphodiesterase class I)